MEEIIGILFVLYVIVSTIVSYVKQAKKRAEQQEDTQWPLEDMQPLPTLEKETKGPVVVEPPAPWTSEATEQHAVDVHRAKTTDEAELFTAQDDAMGKAEQVFLDERQDAQMPRPAAKATSRPKRRHREAVVLALDKTSLRRSVVMAEVLGPPMALRQNTRQLYRSRR